MKHPCFANTNTIITKSATWVFHHTFEKYFFYDETIIFGIREQGAWERTPAYSCRQG
jgi:hypothetical protein